MIENDIKSIRHLEKDVGRVGEIHGGHYPDSFLS